MCEDGEMEVKGLLRKMNAIMEWVRRLDWNNNFLCHIMLAHFW